MTLLSPLVATLSAETDAYSRRSANSSLAAMSVLFYSLSFRNHMATANIISPTISRYASSSARDVMDYFRKHPRKVIQSVTTFYLPPTNTEGSLFGAVSDINNHYTHVAYDYSLTTVENHLNAAMALISEHLYGEYILQSYESNEDDIGYLFTFEGVSI